MVISDDNSYYLATISSDSHALGWWALRGPELQRPLNAGVALMGNDVDRLQTVDDCIAVVYGL